MKRGALLCLCLLLLFGVWLGAEETAVLAQAPQPLNASVPPPDQSPVEIYVDLYGLNIFAINEQEETFEIEAYIYADWFDDRLVFDPAEAGADVKVYQGETAVWA